MVIRIYLEHRIKDVLDCYGNLSDVVNKILEEGAIGNIDIMNKPTCPERGGGQYYNVDIVEPTYLELYELYGPKSSRISLRRLLYWFVDNEIYNELGWEGVKEYLSSDMDNALSTIADIKLYLRKLEKYYPNCKTETKDIFNKLNEIEGNIWDV